VRAGGELGGVVLGRRRRREEEGESVARFFGEEPRSHPNENASLF